MARLKKDQARQSLYSVHPGVALVQKWIAELSEKSGRTLEQWLAFVEKAGPSSEVERREWLKKEHGMGTNSAAWIAARVSGKGQEDESPEAYLQAAEGYVEAMFAGSKEKLRPLYDALLKLALGLADDIRACPCTTMVPLYRHHVFAQIKPSTRTRIDLGFALGDIKASGKLIDTGGFAKRDRITHRIPITALDDMDDEVKRWLGVAYERDVK